MSRRRAITRARIAGTRPGVLARDADTLTFAAAVLRRYTAGLWAEAVARVLDRFAGQLTVAAMEQINAAYPETVDPGERL